MMFIRLGKLLFLCQLGTLVRIFIKFLFTSGYWEQFNANMLIQITGCFLMGVVMKRSDEKEYALAFCGSITTFSGWILIIVKLNPAWASFWLLSTFSIFVLSFKVGERLPFNAVFAQDNYLAAIGLGSFVVCILLACLNFIYFPLPLILSPIGVFLRYVVSLLNNPNVQLQVYLGTFLVNFTGTLGLLLLYKYYTGVYSVAVADGIFGCFTTISSVARDVSKVPVAMIWTLACIVLSWIFSFVIIIS
eukprot:NODE_293_length_11597_cov_0.181771.p5 type:complete len:247 gc:universal NODE_293_length_11597_cov_0.181771:1396-2136(+)